MTCCLCLSYLKDDVCLSCRHVLMSFNFTRILAGEGRERR